MQSGARPALIHCAATPSVLTRVFDRFARRDATGTVPQIGNFEVYCGLSSSWLRFNQAMSQPIKYCMKTYTLIDIQARIRRLERQNRILITILCAMVGVASIAA